MYIDKLLTQKSECNVRMSTKIYHIEFPKWLNDHRTMEQLLVRLLLVYLTTKETGVI